MSMNELHTFDASINRHEKHRERSLPQLNIIVATKSEMKQTL